MFKDSDNRPHLVPLSQALVPWGPGGLVLKKLVGILTCRQGKGHTQYSHIMHFLSEEYF